MTAPDNSVIDKLRAALREYDATLPTGDALTLLAANSRERAGNTLASYVRDLLAEIDGVRRPSAGEQLDEIGRQLDETGKAWAAAGYPRGGPEWEAREAAFARLHQWNEARS